jgi:DnaA family protein
MTASRAPSDRAQPPRQLLLDLGSAPVPTLDSYVPGENAAAWQWLCNWPAVAAPVSPAYFWGPPGSGKTHLLRAMVERCLALGLGVIWLNAQGCQMWDAAAAELPTVALLDDCQALDAEAQHLAFKLFIESAAAAASASQAEAADAPAEPAAAVFVLAAGSVPATDLPVRDDLRTRLGWGLTFALHTLDDAGMRTALSAEAHRRGLHLSDEVLKHLLTRHSRDLVTLMGLLERLDHYALSAHRTLTVPLLKEMLQTEPA